MSDDVIDANSDVGPDMEENEEVDQRLDVEPPEPGIRDENIRRRNDPIVQHEALVLIRVNYKLRNLVIGNWVTG